MKFVTVVTLVVLFVAPSQFQDEHAYLEGAVAKIRAAAILNRGDGGGILPDELQDVIHVLNERINNCNLKKFSQRRQNCQCLTVDKLYRNLNISETTVLNGTKLADLAAYVVYYALNPSLVCLQDAKTVCNDSSCALQFIQDAFLREELDQTNITHEARLQRWFSEIKKTYTPNNKSKCFDAKDIVSDIGLESISDIDFHAEIINELCVALLLRIIEGECILAHKGDEAVVHFFHKYGDHRNLRISGVGFDKLLSDLKFYKSKSGKDITEPCFVEDNAHLHSHNETDDHSHNHAHIHHDHDHDHDHHHHIENVDEQRKNPKNVNLDVHIDDHGHEHEHNTNELTPATSDLFHEHTHEHEHEHEHKHNESESTTEKSNEFINTANVSLVSNMSDEATSHDSNATTSSLLEVLNSTTSTTEVTNVTEHGNNTNIDLPKALALRSSDESRDADHDHGHDHSQDHGHDHSHDHGEKLHEEECAVASMLMHEADADGSHDLDIEEFMQLCPSLLREMVEWNTNSMTRNTSTKPFNYYEVYGYGTLSVFIISLCSLFGILLVPCLSTSVYEFFMMGFIALGFGSMLGDAILHLTPQFLGLHSHSEEHAPGDDHDHEEIPAYFFTSLAVVAAIYAFFVFESCAHIIGKRIRKRVAPTETTALNEHGHSHNNAKILAILKKQSLKDSSMKTISKETLAPESRVESSTSLEMQPETNFTESPKVCCGLKSVALMIILGDTIHNVADGLAIGAAFAVSTRGGISTSIAIFCHEFPHELGDFAILLSTGLSKRIVLGWNFVSSLSAFIGLYAGIAIGMNPSTSQWILAVAAGMFLYIALGDMLPEMKNCSTTSPWLMFFAQNLGVLAGITAMAVIAIYEDKIKI